MPEVDFENLDGAQQKAVIDAIRSAFDRDQLEMLLATRLDMNLADLAKPAVWEFMVFQVVKASQMQGFGRRLVEAVEIERPTAPRVAGLRTTLGLVGAPVPVAVAAGPGVSLERLVRDRSTMRDFGAWLDGFFRIQRRVCRVEGKMFGTGFLVGDDLVLTNYHVVEAEDKGAAAASELTFRFDYSTHDGAPRPGIVVRTADKDWLVKSSPYAASELDFALIRLAEPIGAVVTEGQKRGFIPLSTHAPAPKEGDVVFIVQHPRGTPLVLAPGVIEKPVPGGLRIRYDANTEEGSSGSPVLDASLSLVSLHHAGDPAWEPAYNQGIPIGLIAAAVAGLV